MNLVQPSLKVLEVRLRCQQRSGVPPRGHSDAHFHGPLRVLETLLAAHCSVAETWWQRLAWGRATMKAVAVEEGLELFEAGLLTEAWIPIWMLDAAHLHRPANVHEAFLAGLGSVTTPREALPLVRAAKYATIAFKPCKLAYVTFSALLDLNRLIRVLWCADLNEAAAASETKLMNA